MPKLPKKIIQVVLAVDPATKSGWALGRNMYGVWNLKRKRDESMGMKLLLFRSFLKEVCEKADVTIVAYEKPGGRNYAAVVSHAKLVGEIEKFCVETEREYVGFSASEIKLFATGKGNCGKPAMIAAAQEKLGYEGDDDNEADALWICELATAELNL